jgi:prophage regulatory protein
MDKILRISELKKPTDLARSTIYKKIAEKTFPKPIALTTKTVRWLESEITQWQKERIGKRE